jgi:SAM-dependent methyltransferase
VLESRPDARGRVWRSHSDDVNTALLERWLPQRPVPRIVKTDLFDEAVGRGMYPVLAARGRRVVGVDVSPTVVEAAQHRYPELEAVVADVRRLPFADEAFDVVVSVSTLDHFESRVQLRAGIRELNRVLAADGVLIITLDNGGNPMVALRNHLPRVLLEGLGVVPYFVGATCGPRALRKILSEEGFRVAETTAVMHCPRALAVLGARGVEHRGGPDMQRRYRLLLRGFESLERLPSRNLTGYFVAARANKA